MGTGKHSKNKNYNTSKRNAKNPPEIEKYSIRHAIVNYFLIVMFTLFPLFLSNGFLNIRHDKYYLFIILSFITMISGLALIIPDISYANKNTKIQGNESPWYSRLSVPDLAMLGLLAVSIISTVFSIAPEVAVFGESSAIKSSGRNSGLILIATYVAVYFLVTRFFYYFEYIFAAFAAASSVVFLLAILNGFYIDPLGISENLSEHDSLIFISTIGNIDMMSSFISIALPVAVTMSIHTKNIYLRILYLVTSGLGFSALMVTNSDSGILGIAVFIVVFLVWYSRRIDRVKLYFLAITVMLASAKLLRIFSGFMGDKSKGMGTLQSFFVYSNASYIIIAIAAIITICLFITDYYLPVDFMLPKAVPIALGCIIILAVIAVISAMIYFSVYDTKTNLGGLERFIRFNDKWGTHRGFMWIRSLWIFGDASFYQKIFGTGPDTFYFAFQPYFSDLSKFGDTSTNAAHNEYLNYLVTIGIAGAGAYLTAVIGVIVRAVKYAIKNPFTIVCASAVISYSAQALVNISQPITTPLFILFVALCEAASRKRYDTAHNSSR